MSAEDRVKVLEVEFKLLKNELRQTLGSVRDFLLDLKIPQIPEEVTKEAEKQPLPTGVGSGSPSKGGSDLSSAKEPARENDVSGFEPKAAPEVASPAREGVPDLLADNPSLEDEAASNMLYPPEDLGEDDSGFTSGDMPGDQAAETGQEPDREMRPDDSQSGVPQVNLMANLIRWVSSARRDIGIDQLPVFLDVYATTGNLSVETKDTILHLAEVATDRSDENGPADKIPVVSEEIALCMEINSLAGQLSPEFREKMKRLTELILLHSVYANKADIWSQLLLELHGILTGGGRSLQPLTINKTEESEDGQENRVDLGKEPDQESSAGEETGEVSGESEDLTVSRYVKPARLRLVFPVNDGAEQELDLGSLFISTDSPENKNDLPEKKGNGRKNIVTPKR